MYGLIILSTLISGLLMITYHKLSRLMNLHCVSLLLLLYAISNFVPMKYPPVQRH